MNSAARDMASVAERRSLSLDQAQALHRALISYQKAVRDRGLDLRLLHLPLLDLRPPLPACPTCSATPSTVTVKDCMMTLATNVDFTPCGHAFSIADQTMNQLAQLG